MKVERTDLIKEHLENKGVPVKPGTFKAYLVGKLSQIAGEIEDHLTGGVPAREILDHNIEYFEKFGEALGHNRTHFSIDDVQIPELNQHIANNTYLGYVGWDKDGSPVFAVIDFNPPSIEPHELLETNPEVVDVSEEEFRSRGV